MTESQSAKNHNHRLQFYLIELLLIIGAGTLVAFVLRAELMRSPAAYETFLTAIEQGDTFIALQVEIVFGSFATLVIAGAFDLFIRWNRLHRCSIRSAPLGYRLWGASGLALLLVCIYILFMPVPPDMMVFAMFLAPLLGYAGVWIVDRLLHSTELPSKLVPIRLANGLGWVVTIISGVFAVLNLIMIALLVLIPD